MRNPRNGWTAPLPGSKLILPLRIAPKLGLAAVVLVISALPTPSMALGGGTKEKLKAGGYVILMRYATPQKGANETAASDVNDCATQPNLTENGRLRASKVHDRFQSAGINITRALSSRWCRAIDTAKLLAPTLKVELRDDLAAYITGRSLAERRQIMRRIREEIASWKGPGNLLLVSHKSTIKGISGESLGEGGYIVIDPRTLKVIATEN